MLDSTIPGLLADARRPDGVAMTRRRGGGLKGLLTSYLKSIGFRGLALNPVALFATRWD